MSLVSILVRQESAWDSQAKGRGPYTELCVHTTTPRRYTARKSGIVIGIRRTYKLKSSRTSTDALHSKSPGPPSLLSQPSSIHRSNTPGALHAHLNVQPLQMRMRLAGQAIPYHPRKARQRLRLRAYPREHLQSSSISSPLSSKMYLQQHVRRRRPHQRSWPFDRGRRDSPLPKERIRPRRARAIRVLRGRTRRAVRGEPCRVRWAGGVCGRASVTGIHGQYKG